MGDLCRVLLELQPDEDASDHTDSSDSEDDRKGATDDLALRGGGFFLQQPNKLGPDAHASAHELEMRAGTAFGQGREVPREAATCKDFALPRRNRNLDSTSTSTATGTATDITTATTTS